MLQAAKTDLFNPKAHISVCQNLPFPLQIKPAKVSWGQLAEFYFLLPRHEWVKFSLSQQSIHIP